MLAGLDYLDLCLHLEFETFLLTFMAQAGSEKHFLPFGKVAAGIDGFELLIEVGKLGAELGTLWIDGHVTFPSDLPELVALPGRREREGHPALSRLMIS